MRAAGPLDSCAALFEPLAGDPTEEPTAEDRERLLALCRPAASEPVDVIPSDSRGVTFTDEARGESEYTFADSLPAAAKLRLLGFARQHRATLRLP